MVPSMVLDSYTSGHRDLVYPIYGSSRLVRFNRFWGMLSSPTGSSVLRGSVGVSCVPQNSTGKIGPCPLTEIDKIVIDDHKSKTHCTCMLQWVSDDRAIPITRQFIKGEQVDHSVCRVGSLDHIA